MRLLVRLTLPVLLLFVLAACTRPATPPPTLSEVAGDTEALSSFVALVAALDIDLDAVTATGLFTVFAPCNDLLDAYAGGWGFADAAALLAALDGLSDDQTKAVVNFVASHIISDFPTLMDEDFLTDFITGADWYWYTYPEFAPGDRLFTHVYNDYDADADTNQLEVFFYGSVAGNFVQVAVEDVEFVAADVAIRNGIVHVIDGTVTNAVIF